MLPFRLRAYHDLAMKPSVGDPAPAFNVDVVEPGDSEVKKLSLCDLRGQRVVLVFYPKDSTPGCTIQACAIRGEWAELKERAAIFGVSVDDAKSHQKFISKQELPYPLLSDTSKELVEAYGVWVQKSMFGKKYMGIERSTIVISPEGVVEAVLEKVNPVKHLKLLMNVLSELES